ncbi:hypothetical protein P7D22_17200 [Lichenihabitans sp. Uapishka_5]|uniref:hypothetical protein n=1 Tax=Lichenihabitans sp. Uapishka_5 TaxID=3037302 RepID=UPI0029E811B4|nr:hypothetical protein [Lichenihabitans sp. Uapishka_5]MDX7952905.1 hypothetical protein [Lichenihabitans sp. Uapishka_5]
MSTKFGFLAAVAAVVVAGSVGVASAQTAETVTVPVKKTTKGYASRVSAPLRTRTLTVAAPVGAPPAQPGITSPFGLVTAPIGFAGNLINAPLGGLSQAFGFGPLTTQSRPLPIVARYADAGAVTDSVNQGWAQPVPVSANGPVYKLDEVKGGSVSPFTIIAAPLTATTTLISTPFNAAGSLLGAAPAPAPVF